MQSTGKYEGHYFGKTISSLHFPISLKNMQEINLALLFFCVQNSHHIWLLFIAASGGSFIFAHGEQCRDVGH